MCHVVPVTLMDPDAAVWIKSTKERPLSNNASNFDVAENYEQRSAIL